MISIGRNSNSDNSFRPVFIVGNSRSGTTMMGRILGKSKNIFTFNELHFFEQLWSSYKESKMLSKMSAKELCAQLLSIERDGYLAKRQPRKYYNEAEQILSGRSPSPRIPSEVFRETISYEAKRHKKARPCDQTPRNVFYIEEILRLYPGARIINMVRDPRDVLLSQKKKWKRRFLGATNIPLKESIRARMNYHPITISKLWNSSVKAAGKYTDSSRIHTVFFEQLLNDPHETVKAVCRFLGIQFDPEMLRVPQKGSSNMPDNANKKGINPKSTSSWKNSKGLSVCELYWCQKINRLPMRKYGYEEISISPNKFLLLGSAILFPIQLLLAFVINIRRMNNVYSSIKKRFQ